MLLTFPSFRQLQFCHTLGKQKTYVIVGTFTARDYFNNSTSVAQTREVTFPPPRRGQPQVFCPLTKYGALRTGKPCGPGSQEAAATPAAGPRRRRWGRNDWRSRRPRYGNEGGVSAHSFLLRLDCTHFAQYRRFTRKRLKRPPSGPMAEAWGARGTLTRRAAWRSERRSSPRPYGSDRHSTRR